MTPSIRIWWDTSVQAYRCATPYKAEFVEALKLVIPTSKRSFDPSTKVWTFAEECLVGITALCARVWSTKPNVLTRQQVENAQQSAVLSKTSGVDVVIVEFFRLLPPEAAQAAYRKAAMLLHPDRGGDMDKMSRLNAAWQRIEAEVYKT